jgi:hypothetical protein
MRALFVPTFLLLVIMFLVAFVSKELRGNMSDEIDRMIEQPSSYRYMVNDPCKNAIVGEPDAGDDGYIKVKFVCGDNESIRSLDLRAVDDRSVEGVIRLLGRVENFEFESEPPIKIGIYVDSSTDSWRCYIGETVVHLEDEIPAKATLRCVYGNGSRRVSS